MKEVGNFINDFYDFAYRNCGIDRYALNRLFRSGYCFHFASMLKAVFNRGECYICAPYGHIVWMDTDGILYDADGESSAEYKVLVPISDPDAHVEDFKRAFTTRVGITRDELTALVKKYSGSKN